MEEGAFFTGVYTQADHSVLEVLILEIDMQTLFFFNYEVIDYICPSKPLAKVFGRGNCGVGDGRVEKDKGHVLGCAL